MAMSTTRRESIKRTPQADPQQTFPIPQAPYLLSKFDDRTASLLPELNAVNVYKGLFYGAWDLGNFKSPTSGSQPHTDPNVIATTLVTAQATRGTPTLTVDYPGTKSLAFDFRGFYFGCVVPGGQTAGQLARQCSILVAGFNADNKEVAKATFTFTPPADKLTKAPMIEAVLDSSFSNLHNVTITQTSPATQVLLLDNTRYKLYTSS
ncbi:MAG: hypothetical protein Q9186_001530 [Xanthomendoza sp. 1 TL-2023]